jgi:hypothetical protein
VKQSIITRLKMGVLLCVHHLDQNFSCIIIPLRPHAAAKVEPVAAHFAAHLPLPDSLLKEYRLGALAPMEGPKGSKQLEEQLVGL